MREINLIVIHCSATRCDRDYPFERLDNDHRSRGWNGCGYHYYVTRDGRIHVGRREDQVGAHVGPKFNAHSIGVCYEGGLTPEGKSDDTRTEAQKRSMATLIRDLQRRYPSARILGHRDLPGVRKACPCYDVRADLIAGKSSPGGVNLPDIRGRPYPTGVKPEPNLRQDIPTGVKSEPNPGQDIPTGVKSDLNLGQEIPTGVKPEPNLRQEIPTGVWSDLNLRQEIPCGGINNKQ